MTRNASAADSLSSKQMYSGQFLFCVVPLHRLGNGSVDECVYRFTLFFGVRLQNFPQPFLHTQMERVHFLPIPFVNSSTLRIRNRH